MGLPPAAHPRDRVVVFEKLVQVLVFGCVYRRITDEECSATTLRRRRDEWIEAGAMNALEGIASRLLPADRRPEEPARIAVDCCITKAPCGGERAGRRPVNREKRGLKRSVAVDGNSIPLDWLTAPANRHDSPLLPATLKRVKALGLLCSTGEGAPGPRLRLGDHPRAAS